MSGHDRDADALREGEDYRIDADGNLVFTRAHHLRRGYCCGSGCLNCPYDHEAVEPIVTPAQD